MASTEEHDPSNDFILDAFLAVLPPFGLLAVRSLRALVLFGMALTLTRAIPSIETGLTLSISIAILSLFNMTKWVAAMGIGALLVIAVVPPQVVAKLMM